MSGLSDQHRWSKDQTEPSSAVERSLGSLRSAALGGLALGIVLFTVAAAWLQHAQ